MDNVGMIEQVVVAVTLKAPFNHVVLAQATSGVAKAEYAAVVDWAARVELVGGEYDQNNFFFFELPSERYVVGRLTPRDYVKFELDKFYFECLILDRKAFHLGGANPKSIIEYALNNLCLSKYRPGMKLNSFMITSQQSFLRYGELKRIMAVDEGFSVAVLMEALIEHEQICFLSDVSASTFVSCVYSLLPIGTRQYLTVACGVGFKDDYSTRLIGVTRKPGNVLSPSFRNAPFFYDMRDVKKNSRVYVVNSPWSLIIKYALRSEEDFVILGSALWDDYNDNKGECDEGEFGYRLEDLPGLALQWLGNLFSGNEDDADVEKCEFGLLHNDSDETELEGWKQQTNEKTEQNYGTLEGLFNDDLPSDSANSFLNDARLYDKKRGENLLELYLNRYDRSSSSDVAKEKSLTECVRDTEERIYDCSLAHLSTDEEKSDVTDSKLSLDTVKLAPFAVLSAEFPEKCDALRDLNDCVVRVIKGGAQRSEIDGLETMWTTFCENNSESVVFRVKQVYLDSLFSVVLASQELSTVDSSLRLVGANEVLIILNGGDEKSV